ncbi:MAG TPA: hypothetical protein VHZ99_10795 [Steroidobacteraceae bacterium]|jgi:hypothetical protein|nr:hypothetical protein [Steroidobacteraceae bacterium]
MTSRLQIAFVLAAVCAMLPACATVHAPARTIYLTQKQDGGSVVVPLGTTIDVKLSKMRWTEIQASDEQMPAPLLHRTARPTPSEDGTAAATFVATHPGKVTLMAQGRANCSSGQACPHFLVQWSRTIEIVDGAPESSTP